MALSVSKDGGYKSRKLWLSVFAMCLIFAAACLASKSPAFQADFATLVGGIVGALGIYAGANTAVKQVTKSEDLGVSEETPAAK